MDTVEAQVGSSRVLVEAVEVPLPATPGGRYGTEKTSKDLRDAYAQLKGLLQDVAEDMGTDLAKPRPNWPAQIQLEFGLSFSAEGNIWVMKATGEMTCTVSMTWEKRPK
jgi:hypothetical protein